MRQTMVSKRPLRNFFFGNFDAIAVYGFYLISVFAMLFPAGLLFRHLYGSWAPLTAAADALLLSVPFFWLRPRWRWTVLVPVWLVSVFVYSNFLYFRFFGDLMPFSSYFLWGNLDSAVTGSIIMLMKGTDIALFVLPATATAFYFIFRRQIKRKPFVSAVRWIASAIIIAGFVFNFASAITRDIKEANKLYELKLAQTSEPFTFGSWMRIQEYLKWFEYRYGLVPYVVKSTWGEIHKVFRSRTLSDKEIAEVKSYLARQRTACNQYCPDSIASVGSGKKNLAFVVVESLNSWVIGLTVNGKEVTPVLNSLRGESGTVWATEIVSQIRSGVSSDGQFIYNTGLLPDPFMTTVYNYDDNVFESLVRKLGADYSFEVICESPTLWNHEATSKTYGYDKLHSNITQLFSGQGIGRDESLFSFALSEMKQAEGSFFALLTTISMHGPFDEPAAKTPQWIAEDKTLSPSMKAYLTVTNYFDNCFGRFVEQLKETGLYDDTMIVLASDHTVPVEGAPEEFKTSPYITFMAINTGRTAHIEQVGGQVDVFPTTLDLMGLYDPDGWNGVGFSLLRTKTAGAVDKYGKLWNNRFNATDSVSRTLIEDQLLTSEKMLRADYFAR